MKKIFSVVLVILLIMSGCHEEAGGPVGQTERPTSSGVGDLNDQTERPTSSGVEDPKDQTERPTSTDDGDTVTKPPAEYGSISGDSPVPEKRVG